MSAARSRRKPYNSSIAQDGTMAQISANAQKALTTIEMHMGECNRRQVAIEKSQDEIKESVSGLSAKLTNTTSHLYEKIADSQDVMTVKLDSNDQKTNEKIDKLNLKLARMMGAIYVVVEVIKSGLEHLPSISIAGIAH